VTFGARLAAVCVGFFGSTFFSGFFFGLDLGFAFISGNGMVDAIFGGSGGISTLRSGCFSFGGVFFFGAGSGFFSCDFNRVTSPIFTISTGMTFISVGGSRRKTGITTMVEKITTV
jgi:hypothetical protein